VGHSDEREEKDDRDREGGEGTESRNDDDLRPFSDELAEGFGKGEIPADEHADGP